jgi:hypothetical protein
MPLKLDDLFIDDKLILQTNTYNNNLNRIILYRPDMTFSYTICHCEPCACISSGIYELTDDTLVLHYTHCVEDYTDIDDYYDNNNIHKSAKNLKILFTHTTKYILKEERIQHDIGTGYLTTYYTVLLLNHPDYGILNTKNLKEEYNLYLTQYDTYRPYRENELKLARHYKKHEYTIGKKNLDKALLTKLTKDIIIDYYNYSSELKYSTLLGITEDYVYVSIKDNILAIFYNDYIDISYGDEKCRLCYNKDIDTIKKLIGEINIDLLLNIKNLTKIQKYYNDFPKL